MRVLGLLAACLALVPQARAQTVAQQRERLAALRERLANLEADAAARDSATRAARRLDTLRAGGFTIVTDSGGSARLRLAADSAWAIARRELEVTPGTFRGHLVFARMGNIGANWSDLMRPGDQSVDGNAGEAGLRARMLAAAGAMAAARAGRSVEAWAGGALGLHHNWEDVRWRTLVEMVTNTIPSGRACNAGDFAACSAALGIGSSGARVDPGLSPSRLPAPFSQETASGVLRTAARLGGAGAFDRLVADTSAPLARRLEAMAGVPVDSVLRTWWSDSRGIQRPPVEVPARTQWATLAWTLAFAGLALRSTRWR